MDRTRCTAPLHHGGRCPFLGAPGSPLCHRHATLAGVPSQPDAGTPSAPAEEDDAVEEIPSMATDEGRRQRIHDVLTSYLWDGMLVDSIDNVVERLAEL